MPSSSTALAGSGTDDGTIAGYAWAQVSGPAAATFSPSAAVAAPTVSGLAVAGSYVFSLIVIDNLGAPSAADLVAVAVAPPTGALQVLSFSLMNADIGQPLRPLATGDAVALAALPTPRLNVRANTNPAAVGSVVFAPSGVQAWAQTETVALTLCSATPMALTCRGRRRWGLINLRPRPTPGPAAQVAPAFPSPSASPSWLLRRPGAGRRR